MSDLPVCVEDFLSANDFSRHTVKAFKGDLRKFARWFVNANGERFDLSRVTVRDVADFRSHLREVKRQSVATVNRALVTLRRFLGHAVDTGVIERMFTADLAYLQELYRSVNEDASLGRVACPSCSTEFEVEPGELMAPVGA